MLSVFCLHKTHSLCDLWPVCSCACHPEAAREAELVALYRQDPDAGQRAAEKTFRSMAQPTTACMPEYKNVPGTSYRQKIRYAPCAYPGCSAKYKINGSGKSNKFKFCTGHYRAALANERLAGK